MNNQEINISLFYCSNSFSAEDIHSCLSKIEDVQIRAISLPCSGKVNLLYYIKAIETGSSGVILLTCKPGGCKYLQGNFRAVKRIEAVDELLVESGLGRGCIKGIHLMEGFNTDTLVNEIKSFCKNLKADTHLVNEKI